MLKLIKTACAVAVCLFVISCADDESRREKLRDKISSIMENIVDESGTPGATVYVISDTYGEFSLASGMADLYTETPMDKTQPLRIGSLSKSFTAAAVLKLAGEGTLELNAPINDYLDLANIYPPLGEISIRNIMNMSSGLAPYLSVEFILEKVFTDPLRTYAPEELLNVAFTTAEDLLFEPGEAFLYTNTNYVLLGLLIEKVSGLSYAEYISDAFIKPLGLSATQVVIDATIPTGLARGYYDSDADEAYEDWTRINMSYVWSAGCIVSNAHDIAVWIDRLARGEVLDEAVRTQLYSGRQITEGATYTAGIVIEDGFGIGHNGTVLGYHADAWHDPQTGTSVAVLTNTNNPNRNEEIDPSRNIAEQVLELFRD